MQLAFRGFFLYSHKYAPVGLVLVHQLSPGADGVRGVMATLRLVEPALPVRVGSFTHFLSLMPYKDKNKQNAYQLARMKARREKWIIENGPCKKCGSEDYLQMDHINPSQKVSHRIWSWSEARVLIELAKCQVLCRSCNIAKRWQGKRAKHGTDSKYFSGCRCRACKDAKTAWNRKMRARNKKS